MTRVLARALIVTLWVCALLVPKLAEAAERRYALIVGANEGKLGEQPLRYAEQDAERVAEVLRERGSLPEENIVLLRGVEAGRLEGAMVEISRRVAADVAAGDDPLLFVYYSGHAGPDALHLGSSELELARLRELLEQTPAKLRILVLDACRSGEITRVKGVVPAESFEFHAESKLETEGLAIITSAAAAEDAQESDRLRGGIFTHHFVNGLKGAADESGDGEITLTEAYRYSYVQTLQTTSRAPFVQHPTYAFTTTGQREIVLARGQRDEAHLVLEPGGFYLVFDRSEDGDLVAELSAAPGTVLVVEPGTYLVRRRVDRQVEEGTVRVTRGQQVRVDADSLSRVDYGRTVRKGYAPAAGSITADAAIGGLVNTGLAPLWLAHLGLHVDLSVVSLEARLRYGTLSANDPAPGSDPALTGLALRQHMAGLDLTVLKLFDIRRFAPGIGVRVGGDYIWQVFQTSGEAPTRRQLAGRAGPVVRLQFSPIAKLALIVDLGADIYLMQTDSGLSAPVMPYLGLGLGGYVF